MWLDNMIYRDLGELWSELYSLSEGCSMYSHTGGLVSPSETRKGYFVKATTRINGNMELRSFEGESFEEAVAMAIEWVNLCETSDQVIQLFICNGKDPEGRAIDDMIKFNDEQTEACHNHIQYMFPLHEKSLHAIVSPVISNTTRLILESSPLARKNMKKCLARFRQFLGIDPKDEKKQVWWCNHGNHNLLRITRVIRSLRLFGMEMDAHAFYTEVLAIASKCGFNEEKTLWFWERAMRDPVMESLTELLFQPKKAGCWLQF